MAGRVRRDFEVLEVEARDLLEGRRGDDAAPDRAVRLVDGDEDTSRGCDAGTMPTNEAT